MSVHVRRLQKQDDLRDLVALSEVFFKEYEAHHEELFQIDRLSDEEIKGYFASFLEQADRAAFIALRNDRIVGYITVYVQAQPACWRIKQMGHISGLMVRPEDRREGIGAQLMDQAKAYFKERGVKHYTLYTAVKNGDALAFYQAQGMTPLYSHLLGELAQ